MILSALLTESMILSVLHARECALRVSMRVCQHAESIIFLAGGTESMLLSARAENIIFSAPMLAE
jgi:hypothetical protein